MGYDLTGSWSEEQDAHLMELRAKGLTFKEVSLRLIGPVRTIGACAARHEKLTRRAELFASGGDPMLSALWRHHPTIMERLAAQGLGVVRL